jgi:hypothetical protein
VGKRKKLLERERHWNNTSTYEYNITHYTVNYWLLRLHGDREWVSNGGKGVNLIKAGYIQTGSTKATPLGLNTLS